MFVSLDISETAEEQLREALGSDLDEAATESLLINGYRTRRLSLGLLAEALRLPTMHAARQWLADREVPLNYDLEELESDRRAIRRRLGLNV